MRDPVLNAARDPSCLMCLTPWDGGGWFSMVGGMVQPSATPRNFAMETASWRDFVAVYNAQFVLGHSYRLVCRLRLAAAPAQNLNVFGGDVSNPLSLAVNSSRNPNCSSRLLRTSSVEYVTIGSSQALTVGQWYDVSVFFRNNRMVLKIDQAEYQSSEGYAPATVNAPSIYVGDAPVNIANMEFWDDTTGKRIWQYPSQAEWLRLITKTNVRTDRGVFEPANTAQLTRIKTTIDLRGNAKSLTLVCKAFIPSHTTGIAISGLITQGNYIQYTGTVALFVRENRTTGEVTLRLHYTASSGTAYGVAVNLTSSAFNRLAVFAAQLDYERSLMLLFIDGVEVERNSVTLLPFGQGAGSDFLDSVSVMHGPLGSYLSGHKIEYATMFSRALTAAEIATFK